MYQKLFEVDSNMSWLPSSLFVPCCISGTALVHLPSSPPLPASQLRPGDQVLTSSGITQEIISVHSANTPSEKQMVWLDDFWITRGHPILHNDEWFRPDELYPTSTKLISEIGGIY